ncbi:hypothetical protein ASF04_21225 [Duganella sp. Leaf61]|nr:hypothetical protein ASF04_21225 [Duganella sp. Leaf61]
MVAISTEVERERQQQQEQGQYQEELDRRQSLRTSFALSMFRHARPWKLFGTMLQDDRSTATGFDLYLEGAMPRFSARSANDRPKATVWLALMS